MSTVLAAIDNSGQAWMVLAVAAVADALGAQVGAVHVAGDGGAPTASASADAGGAPPSAVR